MEFKLPILKEKFDTETGNIITNEDYIDCTLNLTVDAQTTWEETFPEQAKNIGLFDYTNKYKDVEIADDASIRVALKIVYCFMLFDRKMTFREFARLFTMTNPEYTKKLGDILAKVISIVNDRWESKKKS